MAPKALPRKLYKYRPFNVHSLRLLTQAEAYYANPMDFNDPLDCAPTLTVDVDRPTLEKLCYKLLSTVKGEAAAKREILNARYNSSECGDYKTDSRADDYLKRLVADEVKSLMDGEMKSKGVLSLAEKWNCPLMWSHYGDEHRGVCIEYDTTEVEHPRVAAVNYRRPRGVRVSDIILWKMENSAEAQARVFDTYFFVKAPQWRYEREWRDISDASGVSDPGFLATAVHFGLRCDAAVVTSIVKLLNQHPKVKLYGIYPLDDSFLLKRRLVDRGEIEQCGIRSSARIDFADVVIPGPE